MRTILLSLLAIGGAAAPPAAAGPGGPDPLDPLPAAEWTPAHAEHLLRRAGFGGGPDAVRALFDLGPAGAVEALLDHEGKPDPKAPPLELTVFARPDRRELLGKSEEERRAITDRYQRDDRQQFGRIRDWWMRLMIATAHPLRERMTLFWHGHFTSSYRDVRDSYEIYIQNALLRRHATGNFAELLHEISKDPAMLEYLDNKSNRKGSPNENYAREVMELFSMGAGNYTEEDIKEAARAFTGWTSDREHRFVFRRRDHDDGEKTFLGRTGRFDGDDVLDIILAQPVTAKYVASRIFRALAHDEPAAPVVEELGRTLREARYELKPLLRRLLLSREFYSDASRGTKIKGPVEFVVGLYRTLALEPPPTPILPFVAGSLGQELFDPPNVKGWDGGRDWITTSHLFNRYNLAGAIVGLPEDRARALQRVPGARGPGGAAKGRPPLPAPGEGSPEGRMEEGMEGGMMPNDEEETPVSPYRARLRLQRGGLLFDVLGDVRRRGLATPEAIVDHYAGALLAIDPPAEMRDSLLAYVNRPGPFQPSQDGAADVLHGLLRLIVSTPEFQLD